MMRYTWTLGLAVLFCASAAASAQTVGTRSAGKPGRKASVLRTTKTPVRDLMRKRVDKVEWVEKSFEEILAWVRGQADDKVNVVPRWNALNGEGVDVDSPVTLTLIDTTVAEVLNEALVQLSEEDALAYRGEGNMLRISTKEDFGRKLETKFYDVTDILFRIPDMGRSAPTIDLEAASRAGGSSGGSGGGQSVFGGASSGQTEELEEEEADVEERLEDLRDTIYAVIEPESWNSEDGGGVGTIQIFNQRALIIRNTIEVHEKIGGFFAYDR
ncbi:MAG: hypothetical protein JSU63_13760 [Phycisphaerales bacterium]|nr:MAG: hypothetical protein JSU63_13760 [Phycisphaerales bacterium]